mgnify:FL=1
MLLYNKAVRFWPPLNNGGLAQLGEHQAGSLGVKGSNPLSSTFFFIRRDLNGAKMYRSEQAKTYADGRAEALWEPKPPNPYTATYFFFRGI